MSRGCVRAVVLVLACSLILPSLARAQPATAYQAAQKAYQAGRYKRVIQLIRPLVVPKTLINSRPKLLAAYKMLAISYVFERDISAAQSAFGALLAEDPKFELDPMVDPAAALKVFREYKKRNAAMLAKIEEAQREAKKRAARAQRRREEELRQLREAAKRGSWVVERRVQKNPYWINFVPFGAGQFQNGHRVKGWLLLTTQIATGAASLGLLFGYTFIGSQSQQDRDLAASVRLAMTVAGGMFWALAIYGVIDAIYYHRGEVVSERRFKRKLGLTIAPAVGPESASLGLFWAF